MKYFVTALFILFSLAIKAQFPSSIRIGAIGDGGNTTVPLGAQTAQYNFDFSGYRDVATDQIGARISALRFNNYGNNIAYVQITGLAFYTNPSGMNGGSSDLRERLRITPSGNIGIGTTTPGQSLEIAGSVLQNMDNTAFGVDAQGNARLGIIKKFGSGPVISSDQGSPIIFSQTNQNGIFTNIATATITERMRIDANGYVGIGTTSPRSILNIASNGSSTNGSDTYTGGLIIQGSTGGRSQINGAQLEFVIPANTDGTNLWGQGRIITVAGNANTSDASGKMIFGTRRMFNKLGTGQLWYYGDDLVIDSQGSIGIGTTSPDAKLAVKGTVHANEVKVDLNVPGPDYVIESDYNLPSLDSIKTYIDQNKHLPEIPSAKEMEKNGVNIGEMNMLLLKKIEEMTLYMIEQREEIKSLKDEIKSIRNYHH